MADVQPIVQALLVADKVYTDQTGKKVICGVFHKLRVIRTASQAVAQAQSNMPILPEGYSPGSPFAYACLTGIHGKQSLSLQYVNLAQNSVLFQYKIELDSKDPLASVDAAIPLPTLPTNQAGTFALEVVWNGIAIGRFRITVEVAS